MRLRKSSRAGHSVVETALMAPWIFLMFIGVLDFGFYVYAAISTAQAARIAAMYTSSSASSAADTTGACLYARQALKDLPNMTGVTTCAAQASAISASQPLAVSVQPNSGTDGTASSVSVTYQTVPLFPIPGLMGQMTITRTAKMRTPQS